MLSTAKRVREMMPSTKTYEEQLTTHLNYIGNKIIQEASTDKNGIKVTLPTKYLNDANHKLRGFGYTVTVEKSNSDTESIITITW